MFRTLQGEGANAGTPALFVRFAGCNMWSGHEQDRQEGNCSAFCDTDFVGGVETSLDEIADAARGVPLIVLTGGEPMLQADEPLRRRFHKTHRLAIETNGTVKVPTNWWGGVWITVSPKVPVNELKQRCGSELKVIVPTYNPYAFRSLRKNFRYMFVQPEWGTPAPVEWVLKNPEWRLSVQTHKYLGIA